MWFREIICSSQSIAVFFVNIHQRHNILLRFLKVECVFTLGIVPSLMKSNIYNVRRPVKNVNTTPPHPGPPQHKTFKINTPSQGAVSTACLKQGQDLRIPMDSGVLRVTHRTVHRHIHTLSSRSPTLNTPPQRTCIEAYWSYLTVAAVARTSQWQQLLSALFLSCPRFGPRRYLGPGAKVHRKHKWLGHCAVKHWWQLPWNLFKIREYGPSTREQLYIYIIISGFLPILTAYSRVTYWIRQENSKMDFCGLLTPMLSSPMAFATSLRRSIIWSPICSSVA